jgi:hypothetical protein
MVKWRGRVTLDLRALGTEFGASDGLVANTKQDCSDSSSPREHGHDRD